MAASCYRYIPKGVQQNNKIDTSQTSRYSMITVHHLDHSQSFRIVWLLEELKAKGKNVDYELKLYKRENGMMAPPDYKAISPLGTSPTVTTSDGLVLSESNAIIEYILDVADPDGSSLLRPKATSPDRNSFLFWFHSVQGSMQPMLTVDIIFRRASKKAPFPISSIFGIVSSKVRDAVIMPRLNKVLELAERDVQKSPFLAGDNLTAADISAVYPFYSLFSRNPELAEKYPACKQWLTKISSLPSFQAAQEKVGEDDIVFTDE